MRGRWKRLLVATVMVAACTALGASASAHQPGGKKAYFDTGEGVDFEFRSFAAGFVTNAMLELDFYFSEKWVGGIHTTHDITLDDEACIGSCRKEHRYTLFAERLWGGRWGHLGLRGGPYVGSLFHQFIGEDGQELSNVGPMFGLDLGASATFTPLRWAGVTLTASAFPGYFVGQQSTPHCWDCFNEENARPERKFEFSAMAAILVRVGDLDGPERECAGCGPAPSSPQPASSEQDQPEGREPAPEDTFLPEGRN